MAKAATKDTLTKYTSSQFQQADDKCDGCDRTIKVESALFCSVFALPAAKWRLGICNFATHAKPEIATSTIKVNPLKASKRASSKGKKK